MTAIPLRVVVTGDPSDIESAVRQLSPAFGAVVPASPSDFAPGDLWAAIGESLRRFDRRIAGEARHSSLLSAGSVLDDWAALNRHVTSATGSQRDDARFSRRYLRMHRDTSIRHARASYDLVIIIGDVTDPELAKLIDASGLAVATPATTAPITEFIRHLEKTL
ncbi:hypothetical protein [Gordonia malaquae]|uniref:hypothetical protein n=1 Tax=Gordonia malaquae TaxID=410332 RepID=UPI0030FEB1B5